MHADALVEPDGAGRVLGVDVERDARRAATPELGERPAGAVPWRAPCLATPAGRRSRRRIRRRRRSASLRVTAASSSPSRTTNQMGPCSSRCWPCRSSSHSLERLRMPLPVLGERLVQRLVERLVLAVAQLVHDEPGREHRLRRRLGQLDRHLVEPAHLAIAARLEERAGSGIGLGRGEQGSSSSLPTREHLAAIDDLRPEAAPLAATKPRKSAASPCTPYVAVATIRPFSSRPTPPCSAGT